MLSWTDPEYSINLSLHERTVVDSIKDMWLCSACTDLTDYCCGDFLYVYIVYRKDTLTPSLLRVTTLYKQLLVHKVKVTHAINHILNV